MSSKYLKLRITTKQASEINPAKLLEEIQEEYPEAENILLDVEGINADTYHVLFRNPTGVTGADIVPIVASHRSSDLTVKQTRRANIKAAKSTLSADYVSIMEDLFGIQSISTAQMTAVEEDTFSLEDTYKKIEVLVALLKQFRLDIARLAQIQALQLEALRDQFDKGRQ